jgi:AcrR family transcriptional regulator
MVDDGVRRRRRGQELEDALLDAAWEELTERGYDAFTIDAVATRAGTSRPVIYRRWPTKQEFVRMAIGHNLGKSRGPVPDTGTLRGDLVALLRQANETRVGVAAFIGVELAPYYRETGTSIADLREAMIGGRADKAEQILARGLARGEVDPAKLTTRIASLPFDLLRLHVLMTFKPLPDEAIIEIVDTIFLPLVTPDVGSADPRPAGGERGGA